MSTGEFPAAQPPERDPILPINFERFFVIAGFIASLCVGYGAYAVLQDREATHEHRLDVVEASQKTDQTERNDLKVQLHDVQGDVRRANDKLDDVKDTLREMKAATVVQAKGHGN